MLFKHELLNWIRPSMGVIMNFSRPIAGGVLRKSVPMTYWGYLNSSYYINADSGQRQPDDFDEIFQARAKSRTHLTEKCYLEQ